MTVVFVHVVWVGSEFVLEPVVAVLESSTLAAVNAAATAAVFVPAVVM